MPQLITAAAIKIGEKVWSLPSPARHHYIIPIINKELNVKTLPKCTQGFLTSLGFFVDRVEAAEIALDAKQLVELKSPPRLYTEDLW